MSLAEPQVEDNPDYSRPWHQMTALVTLPCGTEVQGHVQQFNADEARLYLPEHVRPGHSLTVRLMINYQCVLETTALVHWCEQEALNSTAGVYLVEKIPAEIQAWPMTDYRRSIRYPIRRPALLRWSDRDSIESATITDYSSDGLQLVTSRLGYLGGDLVLITSDHQTEPVALHGYARWQFRQGGNVLVGVELPGKQGRRLAGNLITSLAIASDSRSRNRLRKFSPAADSR